jgi:hypothetical protein
MIIVLYVKAGNMTSLVVAQIAAMTVSAPPRISSKADRDP